MRNEDILVELDSILSRDKLHYDILKEHLLEPLRRELNVLNIFRSALTLETMPISAKRREHADGSMSFVIEQSYNYVSHALDKEAKKALTEWVIDNIDKETVRGWLK